MTAATSAPPAFRPGIHAMTAANYHADPVPGGSLSSSGARKLIEPSCPAIFDYERRHPPIPTEAMNFGSAAHRVVLGAGDDIVVIDAPDYKTKDAQTARKEALAAGKIPLLTKDYLTVAAMARALRANPAAAHLFTAGAGRPEQALFWQDARYGGLWRRALLDWLPNKLAGRRLVVGDYKTANRVDKESLTKAMFTYGFHQQAAWYLDGIRALGLDDRPAFVFVAQMKTPPYLVTVFEPDAAALRIGQHLNHLACLEYTECTRNGVWPGYSTEIETLPLPVWVERQYEQEAW